MSNVNTCENMDSQREENASTLKSPNTDNTRNNDTTIGMSYMNVFTKVNQLNTESAPKNAGLAIKTVENESLNSLLVYDSDSSSSSEMMKLSLNWQVRNESDDETSSSSSEDDDDDDDDESTDSSDEDEDNNKSPEEVTPSQSKGAIRKDKAPKSTGELSLDELPPVPDISTLDINVDNEDFIHMGNVLGIVDKLVTIAAFPNSPAYDLDTLLFLDGKKPLGFVFDVLGQVTSPIYAIRFNSVEDIKSLNVEIGTKVYSAPTSKHTQYVFLQQLLKMKGSDASWMGDNEVPGEFADFSDDENEYYHRSGGEKLASHVKRSHSSDSHKKFESTMNKRNILNTKFNKYMDSYRQTRLNKAKVRRGVPPQINAAALPVFDPTVPPPNLRPFYQHQPMLAVPPVRYMGGDYLGMYNATPAPAGGENNNSAGTSDSAGVATPNFFINNFVANFGQSNSANYFTNHASGNNHPGPSHK